MEKGKVFPYVPVYSLPINPHSALVLPAVRMHPASPLHMRQSSPRAVTSGYHMAAASQGSGLTASPVPGFPGAGAGETRCP